MVVRLTVRHLLRDYLELNRAVREVRWKGWAVVAVAVAMLLVAAWAFVDPPPKQPDMAGIVDLFGFVVMAIGAGTPELAGLGAWWRERGVTGFEVAFGPEGVGFVEDGELFWLGWEHFGRWFVTANLLVLVARIGGKSETLAVPRRCCSADEWAAVKAFVREGLGEPTRG